MRAICGAIITAGALIGLGMAAIGLGTRYAGHYVSSGEKGVDWEHTQILFGQLDNPFKLVLILLVIGLITGVAVAFIGLMYHHHRRHHELLRHHTPHDGGVTQRVT
jgi:hypothetical protein